MDADGATNRGAEGRSPLGRGKVLLLQGFGKVVPGDARELLTAPAWAAHPALGPLGTAEAGGAAPACSQVSESGAGMAGEPFLLQAPLQSHPGDTQGPGAGTGVERGDTVGRAG